MSVRHGYGNDVELSRDVAETILRKRFPFGEVASLKPCRGGGISTVYEVLCSRPDQRFILKVYPESFHWKMEKEVYVYSLLERTKHLSIPSIVLWDDSRRVVPQNYLLMTKLEGQLLSEVAPSLSTEQLRNIYREMGMLLARFHAVTFDVFGYLTTGVIDSHPTNAAYMRFQFEKKLKEFAAFGGERSLGRALAEIVTKKGTVLDE